MKKGIFTVLIGSQRGAALIAVTMAVAMLGTLALSFMAHSLYESTLVINNVRDAQAFFLAETALGILPTMLKDHNFTSMTDKTLFDPATVVFSPALGQNIEGIDLWQEIPRPEIFSLTDPNLQKGVFSLIFDPDDVHPTSAVAKGNLFYSFTRNRGGSIQTQTLMEERDVQAKIGWLSEGFEYPLFVGDAWDLNNDSDPNNDILFSFGTDANPANPFPPPADDSYRFDSVMGGYNTIDVGGNSLEIAAYVDGMLSLNWYHDITYWPFYEFNGCYVLSTFGVNRMADIYALGNIKPALARSSLWIFENFNGKLLPPEYRMQGSRIDLPLGLSEMDYQFGNYTHYVGFETASDPDFTGVLTVNPKDFREGFYESVAGTDFVNAFFEPGDGLVQGVKDVNVGWDRVYYVNGNVWFWDWGADTLRITGRATIIARGNIFIYNNLIYYNDDTKDIVSNGQNEINNAFDYTNPGDNMLVLIALGDYVNFYENGKLPYQYGNIFISDPFLDKVWGDTETVEHVHAFLFAARDFFYNVDFSEFFWNNRIRFGIPRLQTPFMTLSNYPEHGLTIFGGLSVQGLGSGYKRGDARKRVRPYIRRDFYIWDNDSAGGGNYNPNCAFFDGVDWWGQQIAGGLNNDPDKPEHNDPWTADESKSWKKLDGGDIANYTDWAFGKDNGHYWRYDNTSSPPVWRDEGGTAGTGANSSPIIHTPLRLIYDTRITGASQPPGIPEAPEGRGNIPITHFTRWKEVPREDITYKPQS